MGGDQAVEFWSASRVYRVDPGADETISGQTDPWVGGP